MNSRWVFASYAARSAFRDADRKPFFTSSDFGSKTTTSSCFAVDVNHPVVADDRLLAVAATSPCRRRHRFASMAVTSCEPWLLVKITFRRRL